MIIIGFIFKIYWMLRFLNELNRFRNSYSRKLQTKSRSKSKNLKSERHRKTTAKKCRIERSNEYQNLLNSYRLAENAPPTFINPKPKPRRRNTNRTKNISQRIQALSDIPQPIIKIEQEEQSPTNMQLLTKSLMVRNDVKTRMNNGNSRAVEYSEKQFVKGRFVKALNHVYNCIRMLPVINEQCVIGTIGDKMYYFLGSVMYKVISGRTLQMGLKQFLQECEVIFEKATLKDIEVLLSTSAPSSPPIPTSCKQNFHQNFDTDNYLIRQASSVHSSARKTNASTIKQSIVRQSLQFRDQRPPSESMKNSREPRDPLVLSKKQSRLFDKDRVIEEQNALEQLNERLGKYLNRNRQHRPYLIEE